MVTALLYGNLELIVCITGVHSRVWIWGILWPPGPPGTLGGAEPEQDSRHDHIAEMEENESHREVQWNWNWNNRSGMKL